MIEKNGKPLNLTLHAMDSRAVKAMIKFLQGSCKGAAVVVNAAEDADIDVFDADAPASKDLLEAHLQRILVKPVIVLSLQDFAQEGVLSIKKPAQPDAMLIILEQAKQLAAELSDKASKNTGEGDIDLFKDDFFEYLSLSAWAEDPIQKTAPEIFKVVKAPEIQVVATAEPALTPQNIAEASGTHKTDSATLESEMLTNNQGNTDETSEEQAELHDQPVSGQQPVTETPKPAQDELIQQALKTFVITGDSNKTSKHQAAMRLDDKGFSDFIDPVEKDFDDFVGAMDSIIGANDPKQATNADYNPNDYFQGYFQYVLSACREKKQPVMLQSNWCPIALFPYTQEVLLIPGDAELKAFAEIRLKHKTIATEFFVEPLDPKTIDLKGVDVSKFQNMDSFLWKLACWTSKGRYPQDIDYHLPVFLKHWPNFTRLMITPHALRIAALLHRGPRTMTNVADTLNINPRYVFVFISAAYALGIGGQARRLADNLVKPPEVSPSKGQDLLSRMMGKFRK